MSVTQLQYSFFSNSLFFFLDNCALLWSPSWHCLPQLHYFTPFPCVFTCFYSLISSSPSSWVHSLFFLLFLQRAMRVRSHSMETMVGSHRHRSPGVGGGVPASLSGGGLPQSTSECTKSTFTVSSLQQDVTWAKSFGSCSFSHPYLMLEDFWGTFLKCCNTKRSQIIIMWSAASCTVSQVSPEEPCKTALGSLPPSPLQHRNLFRQTHAWVG